MKKEIITVESIIKHYKYKIDNPKNADINRKIITPSIHRLGLEIAAAPNNSKNIINSVVAWGSTENYYFNSLDEQTLLKKLNWIFESNISAIICSKGISPKNYKIILDIASKYKVPSIRLEINHAIISSNVSHYLVSKFAETDQIHGSLVTIFGIGVLVIGKSGIGKSEAVLELLSRGHQFVGDDAIIVSRVGRTIMAKSNELVTNLLEVRGIGLINIEKSLGHRSIVKKTQINLVIELISSKDSKYRTIDRLGIKEIYENFFGIDIKKIQIPADLGNSNALLIESAVDKHIALKNGYDPLEDLKKQMSKK